MKTTANMRGVLFVSIGMFLLARPAMGTIPSDTHSGERHERTVSDRTMH